MKWSGKRRAYGKYKNKRPLRALEGRQILDKGSRAAPPPPEGARLVWDAAQGMMIFKVPEE